MSDYNIVLLSFYITSSYNHIYTYLYHISYDIINHISYIQYTYIRWWYNITRGKPPTNFPQDYDSSDLEDFTRTIMKGCDMNRDGKVSKKVCFRIKDNFWHDSQIYLGTNNYLDGALQSMSYLYFVNLLTLALTLHSSVIIDFNNEQSPTNLTSRNIWDLTYLLQKVRGWRAWEKFTYLRMLVSFMWIIKNIQS